MKYWKALAEIIIGLALFVMIILAYDHRTWEMLNNSPADEWFVVNQLQVESPIKEGTDNPKIFYDRSIFQSYMATYFVTVQYIDPLTGIPRKFCDATKRRLYDPKAKLPAIGVDLKWLMDGQNEKCKFVPGRYRLHVTWNIERGKGLDPVTVERISNVFLVTP
jgi:hypothetical protein